MLSAGAGNELLLKQLGRAAPAMQRRPLKMVMLRGEALPGGVYAHCLGANALPRITITSHFDADGRTVWYIGGQPAEEGVTRTDAEQLSAVRGELQGLFPWLDFSACDWACLDIDRAEVAMADGSRPSDSFCDEQEGVITAWPTKMALAPRLADAVIERLREAGIEPGAPFTAPEWAHPGQAALPWQEEERWD